MNGFSYTPVFPKPATPRPVPHNPRITPRPEAPEKREKSALALPEKDEVIVCYIPKRLLPLVALIFTFRNCASENDDLVQHKTKATTEQMEEASRILTELEMQLHGKKLLKKSQTNKHRTVSHK